MKTSKAIIIASLIIFAGIIFYSFSNRYYIDSSTHLIVNKMTGEVKRPVVSTPSAPEPVSGGGSVTLDRIQALTNKDKQVNKGDFSKVVISGESADGSNPFMYAVTCTVKNNDSIPHTLTVKVIFYDKNKSPILTEESSNITVKPNDIESAAINMYGNSTSIFSYELKLVQSENDGVVE